MNLLEDYVSFVDEVTSIPSKSLLNLSEKFHSTKHLSEKGIDNSNNFSLSLI